MRRTPQVTTVDFKRNGGELDFSLPAHSGIYQTTKPSDSIADRITGSETGSYKDHEAQNTQRFIAPGEEAPREENKNRGPAHDDKYKEKTIPAPTSTGGLTQACSVCGLPLNIGLIKNPMGKKPD